MRRTIEERVSDVILEKRESVQVGGVTYEVAPPSLATLIEVSALRSKIKGVYKDVSEECFFNEAMKSVSDAPVVVDIAATLILGAKRLKEKEQKSTWGKIVRISGEQERKELSEVLLYNERPKQVGAIIQKLLDNSEIGFFFSTLIFLQESAEANKTMPTKTTAYGV